MTRRRTAGLIPADAPILWRAEARLYGSLDEHGEPTPHPYARVIITTYYAVRTTPRGCWVASGSYAPLHHVRDGARRRFAWPTKREALESLVARKRAEIAHLERRLQEARQKLAAAELVAAEVND